MNPSDLLDQFVLEARECLETIGKRLLDVERDPGDSRLLNDLFRSVHTLKGNCGLFDFKALERVVHAAEDLLDRVRNGSLAYSGGLADALLDAMDYSSHLIDQIEQSGRLEHDEEGQASRHAHALRALLQDAVTVPAQPDAPRAGEMPSAPAAAPDWLSRLPADSQAAAAGTALRYTPEAGCFFKGEDPWRLACTAPGLLAVNVGPQSAWPDAQGLPQWDCYQCNLDIVLLSSAPRAYLEEHFRCVAEQVNYWTLEPAPAQGPSGSPGSEVARERAAAIWSDQLKLLARPDIAPGTLKSVRSVFSRLLPWRHAQDPQSEALALARLDALPADASAAALQAWAGLPTATPVLDAEQAGSNAVAVPSLETGSGNWDSLASESSRRGDDAASGQVNKVLKVGQEKIDRLMDLIGEMVVAKNSLPYLAQRAESVFGQRELAREIKSQYTVINRIAEDMQHAIMQVRMLPVGSVFQRFGRLVRDISRKLGKEVNLVVEGEDTEADKNVIESLADPLIHILRNSLDHGIEAPTVRRQAGKPAAGTIRIQARQESDRVIIEISDDGAGVKAARVREKAVERGLIPADRAAALSDADAVQLIFLPGFSTADQISDLSGRGVGMDVVRTAIERVNGSVELSSRQGEGTSLRLSLPLSMAVTNVMVIESAGRRFGVPMDLIVETVRVHAEDVHVFKEARTTVLRGRIVALRALNELLALENEPVLNDEGELAVLVVRIGTESVGLLVDHFHGASDIILKPLEGVLAGLTGFAGTALMGDGGVLMVLNPKELLT